MIWKQANEMLHHKANLNGYLAYQTGQSLEKINQDTDRDFFMSAKEAKDYGLIDGVIMNPLKALQPLAAAWSPEGNVSACHLHFGGPFLNLEWKQISSWYIHEQVKFSFSAVWLNNNDIVMFWSFVIELLAIVISSYQYSSFILILMIFAVPKKLPPMFLPFNRFFVGCFW